MNDIALQQIMTEPELAAALAASRLILFKHSPQCGTSFRAWDEVARFSRENPDVPVRWIDVIGSRPLARLVEERTGIRHESPQILWIVDGRPAAHLSHGRVTGEALAAFVKGAAAP